MCQVEGAFVQGLGLALCEQVVYDEASGALLSGSTWKYKIPTPDVLPQHFEVSFLKVGGHSRANV
jgi:CO/xanthine dehydrogenase Mo-binding subunit